MTVEQRGRHEVFISYSSKDKQWADAVCAVLERHRIRCWIAPRDIVPGSEWGASIIAGIDACKIMLLIFSGNANASAQVRREVERAISKGLSVLPCRVENIAPSGAMEYALSNTHWLDAFTPPVERQLEVLARSVKILLTNPVATPEPSKSDEAAPPSGQSRLSPNRLALAAAMVLLAALAIGFMFTRGKPAETEPPPITSPLEKASQRPAEVAAGNRGGAPVTSPPATSLKARPQSKAIAAVTWPEPEEAQRFLERCRAGQFAEATEYFDATMKSVLSATQLEATWKKVTQQYGPVEKMGPPRLHKVGASTRVKIRCEFKSMPLDALVSFNAQGQIEGFFLNPAEKAAETLGPAR
jgi:hypothetical protein